MFIISQRKPIIVITPVKNQTDNSSQILTVPEFYYLLLFYKDFSHVDVSNVITFLT